MMRIGFAIAGLLIVTAAAQADDSKPALAQVTLTGKPTLALKGWSLVLQIQPGQDVQGEIAKALKECVFTLVKTDNKTAVVVALPGNAINFNELALATLGTDKMLGAEGILTTTEDKILLASSGSKDMKRIPILIAKTAVWVDEKNKDQYPPENRIRVRGVVRNGEVKIGPESFALGIVNGDGVIPIVLPKDGKSPENGATVRGAGRVRSLDGRPIVQLEKFEAIK